MYRKRETGPEFLLAHPGGPFFAKKDEGAWSIPKGLVEGGEDLLEAAKREFEEETGFAPQEPFIGLGSAKYKNGKTVHAWAFEGDFDPGKAKSNTFKLEWPPRSGRFQEFPEIDRAAFFTYDIALAKIVPDQAPLLERLAAVLDGS